MCLDVAEYGVRSAVETTSAMVKLAFKLEFYGKGADTSRAHSLVIEVCERNVSTKFSEKGEEEGRRTTGTVRVTT